MKYQEIASEIYTFLKSKVQGLPDFYFQLGLEKNNAIIFSLTNNTSLTKYYEDTLQVTYDIRLYLPKDEHQIQYNNMIQIINNLCSQEFKSLKILNQDIITYWINDLPTPNPNLIIPTLDNYDSTTQSYLITLDIIIKNMI